MEPVSAQGNRHLLAYIWRRTSASPHCYGQSHYDGTGLHISPQLHSTVPVLVRAKNAWVAQMERIPPDERTQDDMRETFEACMLQAESEISSLIR